MHASETPLPSLIKILLDSIDTAGIIHDLNGHVLSVNDHWLQVFNLTSDEALSYLLFEDYSVDPETDADFHTIWIEANNHHTSCYEKSIRHPKTYQVMDVEVHCTRISFEDRPYIFTILRDITKVKRLEKTQSALVKISEAVGSVATLNELFKSIHQTISELLPADNFYIALHDPKSDLISFPYFVDAYDTTPPPMKSGRGLTEYVLRNGNPLLAPPEVFTSLVEKNEVESMGAPSLDWLGVPLKTNQQTIGVMAVQSYSEDVRFSYNDLQFLSFVSNYVASAIVRKKAEEELRKQHDLVKTYFECSPNAIFVADLNGHCVDCNQAFLDLTGLRTKDQVYGTRVINYVHEDDRQRAFEDFELISAIGGTKNIEYRVTSTDGRTLIVQVSATIISKESDSPHFILGMITDITQQKLAEQSLRTSEERYSLALEGANDGIWDWDLENNCIYYSPRWKNLLGFNESEVNDEPDEWFDRIHPDDMPSVKSSIEAHLTGLSSHIETEFRMQHKNGSYLWVMARGNAIHTNGNRPHRVAGSMTDISRHKLAESRLMHEALHDKLTNLPNRTLFVDRLYQAIKRSKRHEDEVFAVLFLDLDRFKVINDSLGHLAGDKMLITIAERLESCVRVEDTVARMGGDEFALLIASLNDPLEVVQVANRIQRELSIPFILDGQPVYTTCSIGITLSTTGYEKPEEVLRDADTAMYQAKAQGGGRYEIFDRLMHTRAVQLLLLETDLRRALELEQFILNYQPIFSIASQTVVNLEALIRWKHPTRGLIMPGNFITLAEETGMIIQIGEWVLRTACSQLKHWHTQGYRKLNVAVNLSARQFQQPDLPDIIQQVLRETRLEPHHLYIEITESRNLTQLEKVEAILWDLKKLGVKISIDDFGTGYSSLSTLQRLPMDVMKIGQSFIADLGKRPENDLITESIIQMGHKLGLDVIAEGVETESQLAFLIEHGCDMFQGYLFSPPVAPKEISRFLGNGTKSNGG